MGSELLSVQPTSRPGRADQRRRTRSAWWVLDRPSPGHPRFASQQAKSGGQGLRRWVPLRRHGSTLTAIGSPARSVGAPLVLRPIVCGRRVVGAHARIGAPWRGRGIPSELLHFRTRRWQGRYTTKWIVGSISELQIFRDRACGFFGSSLTNFTLSCPR